MKVLFDAYWWVDGPPSGRNVVLNTVRAWGASFPRDQLTIRVRAQDYATVRKDLRGTDIAVERFSALARVHAVAATTMRADKARYDAVIAQNFSPLTGSATKAVLVHDAIFVEHPEWFSTLERAYLSFLRPTLKSADLVLTTSASETQRIQRSWPEVQGRCVPVGLGNPLPPLSAARKPSMPIGEDVPFILAVGRINVRKNLARLIEAMNIATTSGLTHHLVIVGSPDGTAAKLPSAMGSLDRVHFLGFVEDDELSWLYRNTAVFAFPSLDEGFGLPIVEAAQHGAIVAASDIPVFRELNLVDVFFNPAEPESIAAALLESTTMATRTPKVVTYSWTRTVEAMRRGILAAMQSKGAIA